MRYYNYWLGGTTDKIVDTWRAWRYRHSRRWTLREGLALIRSMQPSIHACGFHACLAGGVLNKGYSDKDLDIWILPMFKDVGNSAESDRLRRITRLMAYLDQILGSGQSMADYHTPYPTLAKTIYHTRPSGLIGYANGQRRIDVFVVGFGE